MYIYNWLACKSRNICTYSNKVVTGSHHVTTCRQHCPIGSRGRWAIPSLCTSYRHRLRLPRTPRRHISPGPPPPRRASSEPVSFRCSPLTMSSTACYPCSNCGCRHSSSDCHFSRCAHHYVSLHYGSHSRLFSCVQDSRRSRVLSPVASGQFY